MVDWWFGYLETTEHYKWWHPKDHVWCEWKGERGTGRYVGGEHHVHEFIGGELAEAEDPLPRAGRAPRRDALRGGRRRGRRLRARRAARRAGLERAPDPPGARHRLRLRDAQPLLARRRRSARDRRARATRASQLVPDRVGPALLKHCHEEMSYLAAFLPALPWAAREALTTTFPLWGPAPRTRSASELGGGHGCGSSAWTRPYPELRRPIEPHIRATRRRSAAANLAGRRSARRVRGGAKDSRDGSRRRADRDGAFRSRRARASASSASSTPRAASSRGAPRPTSRSRASPSAPASPSARSTRTSRARPPCSSPWPRR